MRRRAALIAVSAALALALVALTASVFAVTRNASEGEGYRGSLPPAGIELAAFSLRSYRGEVVSSDSLRGKVLALTFLESKCKEACPVIAFQVARGMEQLSREQREGVRAIAISTHPVDDTPASVRIFLEKQRAVDALDYLVGDERELRPVWERYKVLSALDSGNADTHSASVHIYDRSGVWVSTLHPGVDLSPDNLAHDLVLALGS
jgi:protein SCO1/2